MSLVDVAVLVLRVLGIGAGLWLLWECRRTIKELSPKLTHKGRTFYFVLTGWGLVSAYGLSEQLATQAGNGIRTLGTLSVLAASIYAVRLPGSTRFIDEQEPR